MSVSRRRMSRLTLPDLMLRALLATALMRAGDPPPMTDNYFNG